VEKCKPEENLSKFLHNMAVTSKRDCARGMNKKNYVTAITNVHGVFKAELPATM